MSEMAQVLRDVYAALAELWCSPRDVDREEVNRAAGEGFSRWESMDEEGAAMLARFLEDPIPEEGVQQRAIEP